MVEKKAHNFLFVRQPGDTHVMTAYFEYFHTVSEQDIDELGHAGNFHYIKWMQHAAIAHSSANGWPPHKYIELGAGWVVRSHKITYLKQAFEGDSVVIKTWVASRKTASSQRCYEIVNDKGEMLATAETTWAFVNYKKQKPIRIPDEVLACFELAGTDPVPGAEIR
jgi:acyl-CoA thioester hydrolase